MHLNFTHCQLKINELKMMWIEQNLGPQIMPLIRQILIGFIYSSILCTGILGNLATCIVIAHKPYMRTRTNCYLFTLAVSDLLLLVFGLPFELQAAVNKAYPWKLGTVFCRLRVFLTELCPLVSILLLTIFSAERYLSICHPFRHILRFSQNDAGQLQNRELCWKKHRDTLDQNVKYDNQFSSHCKHSRDKFRNYQYVRARKSVIFQLHALKSCFLLISVVWIFAAICATPIAGLSEAFIGVFLPDFETFVNHTCTFSKCDSLLEFQTVMNCIEFDHNLWRKNEPLIDSYVCAPSVNSPWAKYLSIPLVLQLWTFLFFFTPMIIMSVLYGRIAIRLRQSNLTITSEQFKSKLRLGGRELHSNTTINSRRGVIRMLVAVVVAFFICWAPFHLQRVLTSANVQMTWFVMDFLFYSSGVLYYMSSTVNPILYSLMSARFRRAFIATFHWKKSNTQLKSCTHPIIYGRNKSNQPQLINLISNSTYLTNETMNPSIDKIHDNETQIVSLDVQKNIENQTIKYNNILR